MTSLMRCATDATASLPSIVTICRFDMLPPDAECARRESTDAATANCADRSDMPVRFCKARARLAPSQKDGVRWRDITRTGPPIRLREQRRIDAAANAPDDSRETGFSECLRPLAQAP